MQHARYRQVAVLLTDGEVLLAGGASNAGVLANAETFDPRTGKFRPTGLMKDYRRLYATATAQGYAIKDAQRRATPLEKDQVDVTGVWRCSRVRVMSLTAPHRVSSGRSMPHSAEDFPQGRQGERLLKVRLRQHGLPQRQRHRQGRPGTMGTSLLQMRVMMPDGSDCIFNGRPMGNAIDGSYLCLQGGGLIERGIWRAGRNY